MQIGSPTGQGQVQTQYLGKNAATEPQASAPQGQVVAAEAAPFISPVVNFDYQSGIAVFEVRDGTTGEVTQQYPSKKVVEEYRRHGASSQQTASAAAPGTPAAAATGSDAATTAAQGAAVAAATAAAPPAAVSTPAPAAPGAAGIKIDG